MGRYIFWSMLLVILAPSVLPAQEPIVVNTDLVTVRATVMDAKGNNVPGLEKSAFTIQDNDSLQKITAFSDEDTPISVAVVFDISGSMSEGKTAQAKQALAGFIQTSQPLDEFFLVSFDSQAHLLLDRSRDGDAVLHKFTYFQTGGNTALYDALYLGLEKVTHGTFPRRAILLITDGEDNNSRYTFKEVRRRLQESDVSIYSIGIREGLLRTSAAVAAEMDLRNLATISGGETFFPRNSLQMDEAFERIALELRHQYSIGYRPENFVPDGKWHRLKVRVTQANGTHHPVVRSRQGYYAVANSDERTNRAVSQRRSSGATMCSDMCSVIAVVKNKAHQGALDCFTSGNQ
ncbi:MAG TPA: VWA domain-containing protein [Pyrinomonadaceae bacterium]|nr:VWA domain-containing protein [Pyrinomonadaceae bacterium]